MEQGPEHDYKPKELEAVASNESKDISFKKPTLLIGKVGRLPKKADSAGYSGLPQSNPVDYSLTRTEESPKDTDNVKASDKRLNPKPTQGGLEFPVLPYTEPPWSGLPVTTGKNYVLEVLKEGRIIDYIDLMKKPFWVFGRMTNCDILKEHPSVSRYHVLLQYRKIPSESEPQGFYLYDLGSTHGTFVNGRNKLKPKTYMRYQVGHVFRVGTSKRHYILTGPETDQEEESELSVTELKQLKAQKLRERQDQLKQLEMEREQKIKQEAERGIDWGMGEEANDEDEIAENPFASTNNEELYLDDPKKALRGFFEREGLDLNYDFSEQGMGQFLCKVELPLDDERGRPLMAEVLHRGKKKEAVVQCALEACRILDRAGILRQATHESRKRKIKDWEENDFYDSDEDTFLDRTGTIEKKRENRMKVKQPDKAETYENLVQKEKDLAASIAEIEKKLTEAQTNAEASSASANAEEDSLDSYMKGLSDDKLDKQTVSKLKLELTNLRKEHANIIRLANLAKPADMPSLAPASTSTAADNKGKKLPIFGKRRIVPVKYPATLHQPPEHTQTTSEAAEEESDEEMQAEAAPTSGSESRELDEGMPMRCFKKFLQLRALIPDASEKYKPTLLKILQKSQRLAAHADRATIDWKCLGAKLKKVMRWGELEQNDTSGKLQHMIYTELNRIVADLNHMSNDSVKADDMVEHMEHVMEIISMEIDMEIKELKKENSSEDAPAAESRLCEEINESMEPDGSGSQEEAADQADKKKKKNLKRIEHRTHKAEMEKQKGYAEDATKEDYSMWVPPTDQSGDGRTKLNEKFGY